jgi:hypothetical protein
MRFGQAQIDHKIIFQLSRLSNFVEQSFEPIVAFSSTKAEYQTLMDAAKKIIWIRTLLL